MPEGNESESTNDDSKTMKRLRPTLFRNNKRLKGNSSNFDDLFQSDGASEIDQSNSRHSRSSLKRKSKELNDHTTSEVFQKLRKTQLEKVVEADSSSLEKTFSKSRNKTLDETVLVTPVRELRNRSIMRTSTHKTPIKSSQKHVGATTVYDPVDMSLTMVANNTQKKKAALFSQENKSRAEQNSPYSESVSIFEITNNYSKVINFILFTFCRRMD